ncbi:hypothetical protein FQA39_LY19078 [Lamprigera yunnana]|nr:hypothetical protein FQA39_LY19078 [Lamprigera yunnana]
MQAYGPEATVSEQDSTHNRTAIYKYLENATNVEKLTSIKVRTKGYRLFFNVVVLLEKERRGQKDEAVSLPIPDDEVEVKPTQGFNSYAANKNAAQGMMDIALITANANQLRYMLAYNRGSSTYIINLFLVSLSLLLQIAVGIGLVLKTKLDKKDENEKKVIRRINSFNVIGVLLITITNVFIASFTVTPEYSPSTDKTGSHSTS